MIKLSKNLYFSKDLDNIRVQKLKIKLNLPTKTYILAIVDNLSLELFPSKNLKAPNFKNRDIFIVGLSSNKKEAILLLSKMYEDCIRAKNNHDLQGYLYDLGFNKKVYS